MSYDDRQAGAVLVTCPSCQRAVYMVVVHPVCQGCRYQRIRKAVA